MNEAPKISVVLPVYNGERFIVEALDNITEQNYPNLEVILIDDGSTDNTSALVERFLKQQSGLKFNYYYQDHSGVSCARNHGLDRVSNELVAFLDVDDLWPKGKLLAHVQRINNNHHLDAVLGYTEFVQIDARTESMTAIATVPQMLLGAGLFRRRLFEKIGRFDTALQHGEDWDWFLRCREASIPMKVFSDTSLTYRRHTGNLTLQKKQNHSDFLRLLKQSLDRRRTDDSIQRGLVGTANNMAPWSSILDPSE